MSGSKSSLLHLPKLGELDLNRIANFSTHNNWLIKDPERFKALMEEAKTLVEPGYYLGDNLFTWGRNNSLFDDATFRNAYESNMLNGSDQAIAWRRYILACAAYHCVQLTGDFVECGVYSGTGIKTVMDYLGGPAFPRNFWGYDTYDYNPVPGHAFEGQEAGFYEKIVQRFDGYMQVRLIKGLLPDSFAQGMPEGIAYLHIDLNSAEAELAVLGRLFDRVVSGGIVIMDDYEWSGAYRAQKKVEDPWFERQDYRVFPLPTGQGMILKR
jgi:hypothetical protein